MVTVERFFGIMFTLGFEPKLLELQSVASYELEGDGVKISVVAGKLDGMITTVTIKATFTKSHGFDIEMVSLPVYGMYNLASLEDFSKGMGKLARLCDSHGVSLQKLIKRKLAEKEQVQN